MESRWGEATPDLGNPKTSEAGFLPFSLSLATINLLKAIRWLEMVIIPALRLGRKASRWLPVWGLVLSWGNH